MAKLRLNFRDIRYKTESPTLVIPVGVLRAGASLAIEIVRYVVSLREGELSYVVQRFGAGARHEDQDVQDHWSCAAEHPREWSVLGACPR